VDPNSKTPESIDPETAIRLLELELMQERAARQKKAASYNGLRIASFMFLVIIVLAAALAFYYVFFLGGLDRARGRRSQETNPNATELSEP